jgi:type 1 glutamine amidotransferase
MVIKLVPAILLASVLLNGGAASCQESQPTKILFIGTNPDHPYGSHMYMHTCGVLAECAELSPGVETVVSNGWPADPKTLEGVKAIVVYTNPAAELLLDGPHRDEVDAAIRRGVGLVTIHWASTVRQPNLERLGPTWLGYLGGTWVSNVGLSGGTSKLKQLAPDHPICRGWSEYEIEDEYYLNPIIKDARPFLQVRERGGKDVVVSWVYERPDGGRSFATTLGHPYKNFQIEAFRRMIVNAILWSAKREVPAEGAPVHVSEEALALPPQAK